MSDSELTFAAHERFGHDLLVTTESDLLQLSASTDNANILRPSLALPLVHLYLRSRGTFIYDAGDLGRARSIVACFTWCCCVPCCRSFGFS